MNGARRVGLAAGGRRVLHVHGSTIIQYIASVSTVPMGKTKLLVRGALHRAGRARWLEPTEAGPGLARCARGLSYRPARREPGVPAASSPRRVRYRQHCRPGRSSGAIQREHRVQLNGRLAVPVLIFLRASDYFGSSPTGHDSMCCTAGVL